MDPARALDEWLELRSVIDDRIGPVLELRPEPWATAMTFTRDLAVVVPGAAVALMPTNSRGPFEAPLSHRRLSEAGIVLQHATAPLRFDGGNVLADSHGRLLIGVTANAAATAIDAVRSLEAATGRDAYRVPLAGGRFPHVDMAVCDLAGAAWLIYPQALAGYDEHDPDWRALFLGRPVIEVDTDDGEQLACNLVVGDGVVVGPPISSPLRRQIEAHDFEYLAVPLGELRKAGGGAHCLTLELPPPQSTAKPA